MGEVLRTRSFSLGSSAFSMACSNDAIRNAIEAVFADLPDGTGIEPSTEGSFELGDDGFHRLRIGARFAEHPSGTAVLASLVTAISRLSLDDDPAHLHVHGALLERRSRGVLISAESGTGKTTLTAALCANGWTYLSDEAAAIESDGRHATAFAKPLLIKERSGGLLADLEASRVVLEPDDESWWHIPASRVAPDIAMTVEPSVIVLLRRHPSGDVHHPPVLTRVHPTDAVVALMNQTMDAGRFGPDAVVALATLAARSECVTMTVGPLDVAVDLLETLVADDAPAALTAEVLERPPVPALGWSVPESVRTVRVGDRAVVHQTDSGAVVALDEAGTALWSALHGRPPSWFSPDIAASHGARSFLEALVPLGFVRPIEEPA